ncbi:MAG: thioredoxin domain-containing protein [Archangium sp.]|nr:thioredoxin domain-containing protein [Archangium sp.]
MISALVITLMAAAPGTLPDSAAGAAGLKPSEDIALARKNDTSQVFTWLPYAPESFARAKREGKVVLIDCAAEWCHWCHVMDETTYRDAAVGAWLAKNGITIRVDIDERPDIADRYGDWGWPATILLSPNAEELGKFRGYLPPEKLLGILQTLDASKLLEAVKEPAPLKPSDVPRSMKYALERLDWFWDENEGSWGLKRKTPIGMNVQWELLLGTKESIARADFTLGKQRVLIDPVWGGLSQYSASTNWSEPHFEKLMAYQAANLVAYAQGFEATKKQQHLDDARALFRYMTMFLRSPEGTFFVNQDADLNAHDRSKPFVDGHTFYALDDAGRRKLGIPWVDTHVYASENGKAIVALVAFAKASGDVTALDAAKKAADQLALTHVLQDGSVKHEAKSSDQGPFLLEDAAWLGLAYARLGNNELASKIAARMVEQLADPKLGGALFEHTVDADAVGVFARRAHPFAANVTAARLLAAVGQREKGRGVLAAVSAKERLENEWAWVGDYLIAARELGF